MLVYLNSNIEIHKSLTFSFIRTPISNLNSNIEIHKWYDIKVFKGFVTEFKF